VTRVYLIRHAEAHGNIGRVFQGHSDGDVSENGIKQLQRLSERCRSLNFDAIYSSPLQRAYKTAQAANLHHGLPIITLDSLKEINGGHWEGKLFKELPVLFPDEHDIWENEPWNFNVQGGESMQEVFERIWGAVQGIVISHPNQSVCVVSHGCAIRNFLCRAYAKELCELNTIDWCDNTAISIIDFDENLKAQVVLANDASHLDKETSTINKQEWWIRLKGGAEQ
jgi:broad specificity phosphatase PhoE